MIRSCPTVCALTLSFCAFTAASPRAALADDDPIPSAATPPASFGARGVLAIGSDASGTAYEELSTGTHSTSVNLQPAVDYFVANHLSLGASLWFAYSSQEEPSARDHEFVYGIGPRVGYDLPLSEHFSLWPKLSGFVSHSSDTFENTAPASRTTDSGSNVEVELFVPVMFHPVPHFFVGIGPFAEAVLTGAGSAFLGGKITIGGWVGP
jgi:hypothetical protein